MDPDCWHDGPLRADQFCVACKPEPLLDEDGSPITCASCRRHATEMLNARPRCSSCAAYLKGDR